MVGERQRELEDRWRKWRQRCDKLLRGEPDADSDPDNSDDEDDDGEDDDDDDGDFY